MAGIFKAYDIRGIYGEVLTDEMAYDIGRAFATLLKPRHVVVGRDIRAHSPAVFAQLARGLTELGVEVTDLGLCSTPMSYYANGSLGADGGVMITASHNPKEYNGFKLCRAQGVPISGATGIQDIERIIRDRAFDPPAAKPGALRPHSIARAYAEHLKPYARLARPVKIAVDYANAMGILEAEALKGVLEMDPLFDTLDGNFPNHEANPLDHETLRDLQAKVRGGGYDFGVAFDGDADRAGFVDERGEIVPMDMITGLIAQAILKEQPGAAIYYDLRSSWAVKEVILENGGRPMMSRVGHAFIKQQMREADAVFAGELSGHYYFKENYYTESAALAVMLIANLVSRSAAPLSQLVQPMQRYFASGEINSRVAEPQAVMDRLLAKYPGGTVLHLDGLTIEFPDWWFNVRTSNTEPLVRLNLEAKTKALMVEHRDEVLGVIRA
jgi:phosphomannomutase